MAEAAAVTAVALAAAGGTVAGVAGDLGRAATPFMATTLITGTTMATAMAMTLGTITAIHPRHHPQ